MQADLSLEFLQVFWHSLFFDILETTLLTKKQNAAAFQKGTCLIQISKP